MVHHGFQMNHLFNDIGIVLVTDGDESRILDDKDHGMVS